jgi:hypothetical protein
MCVIVVLALAGTAYLAVIFNRRAKTDLAERMQPLAAAIGGELDLDEATVSGRYQGQIAFGRVANAPGGFGRLFHVEVIDAAGGSGWEWSSLPEKNSSEPCRTFEGDGALATRLDLDWDELAQVVPHTARQRFGFAYDPASGKVSLIRAMHTRLDIPDVPTFLRQLDTLLLIGDANRRAQGAPPVMPNSALTEMAESQA